VRSYTACSRRKAQKMSDIDELWSIDPYQWGVEVDDEAGPGKAAGRAIWMVTTHRDAAIQHAREEKAKKPESRVDVVALDEDHMHIGQWEISTIPTT
jgi:hypothetical protein